MMSTTNTAAECTVDIGSADRPTRFQVNPVGGNTNQQNGTSIPTIETTTIAVDPVAAQPDSEGHEMLRLRHPASASLLDVEAANEVDSFPETGSGAKIISSRPQSR